MRVEDAARDVEMRDRVAVVEHARRAANSRAPLPAENAMEEASTNEPFLAGRTWPRMGCSVKVGQLAEEGEAVVDLLAGELLEALGAESLHRE